MRLRRTAAWAAAVLLAGCGLQGPGSLNLSQDIHSPGAAQKRAAAMLKGIQLPAGATSLKTAPAGLDTGDTSSQSALPSVDLPGWWTVPGQPPATAAYLLAHPPAGMTSGGDTSGTTAMPAEVSFSSPDQEGCDCNLLVFKLVPQGDHTAVRADAQVIWRKP